jgi:hypothetical protein
MGGLSIVTGGIATLTATSAYLLRKQLPLPLLVVLAHAAVTGFAISASSCDALCDNTTWLLGKVLHSP